MRSSGLASVASSRTMRGSSGSSSVLFARAADTPKRGVLTAGGGENMCSGWGSSKYTNTAATAMVAAVSGTVSHLSWRSVRRISLLLRFRAAPWRLWADEVEQNHGIKQRGFVDVPLLRGEGLLQLLFNVLFGVL
jgi:hypothetical protein